MALADADRIAAARAYVDALVSHDASNVPLTPGCTRVELGVKTGRNGDHIRRSLNSGPQFKLIHRISEFTATVDGDTVDTTYYVHVHPKPLGLAARVVESFVVTDAGEISSIVASFSVPRRKA
ncbi:hypothetical protein [Gordonia hydrophobica]|uniref:DUF8021 domain-containing protein n=1 Tax=Gordonia hydrophobica TaxID=40516 RepID=A0ABZ2TVQ1_9ACTN|nr:hypothetical protein [Gordonia hydrophobica]MBM7366068.1 hypothetical protein [Gordonia hydrophobica]